MQDGRKQTSEGKEGEEEQGAGTDEEANRSAEGRRQNGRREAGRNQVGIGEEAYLWCESTTARSAQSTALHVIRRKRKRRDQRRTYHFEAVLTINTTFPLKLPYPVHQPTSPLGLFVSTHYNGVRTKSNTLSFPGRLAFKS